VPDAHQTVETRSWRALTIGACLLFLAYAGCFLYFFVDDEAIPLVYARNLLRGRGLAYTILEGRVEGYSDFLHVVWSSLLLSVTDVLGLSRLAPLLAGKAVSLAAGVAIVALTGAALRQLAIRLPAAAGALVFLALAGPLAVWSASSLETASVALTVLAFALATWQGRVTPAVVFGILLTFERIDAPVYLAAVLLAGLAASPRAWKTLALIAALVGFVALAFHGWRLLYFGTLLSTPLAAKVLHRLAPPDRIVVKSSDVRYLLALAALYGWPAIPALGAAAIAACRRPLGRAAVAMLVIVGLYAARVDDWMFGWRFAVVMAPFAAMVLAMAVDRLPRGWSAAVAVLLCVWSGLAAAAFVRAYVTSEERPVFWLSPRGGQAAWLGRYDEAIQAGRRIIHPGDRIAFNQAGLLPYVLDAENIDDLGICSSFVARLPTTDVFYTGVGRYSPLTDVPLLRAAHAYLLYQNVQVIVEPADLVVKANAGRVPDVVLDGAFQRVARLRDTVIYRRTDKPMDRFREDARSFTENLTHSSRIVAAAIDGRRLADKDIGPELAFLRELGWSRTFERSLSIELTFAAHDELVTRLYIRGISTDAPATLSAVLTSESGREVFRTERAIGPQDVSVLLPVTEGAGASHLVLAVTGAGSNRLAITDLRLEGQSAALGRYVRHSLRFPAP
jgi:hypothetical protein